jgi:Hg(II)-responsive transcriptional regulator
MRGAKAVQSLKTGELAKRAGVNVETLRFYERKGLLPGPPRRASGCREYPVDSVRVIRFITRAQELGFSLREIRELLALQVQPGVTCAEVRDKAEQKAAEVRRKIADLTAFERALQKLTASCSGRGPATDCPILEHLDGEILRLIPTSSSFTTRIARTLPRRARSSAEPSSDGSAIALAGIRPERGGHADRMEGIWLTRDPGQRA